MKTVHAHLRRQGSEQLDGDPKLWRVENGNIVGETRAETMPKQKQFSDLARR
jgi:hypothetical protein